MFPGLYSRLSHEVIASAATINVKTDVVILTGSTGVNTINAPFTNMASRVVIIAGPSAITFGTSGNILVGAVVAINRPCEFIWNPVAQKWHIGPIS
jgi:uncharacterized protein (DUF4213/DUF364 family)